MFTQMIDEYANLIARSVAEFQLAAQEIPCIQEAPRLLLRGGVIRLLQEKDKLRK